MDHWIGWIHADLLPDGLCPITSPGHRTFNGRKIPKQLLLGGTCEYVLKACSIIVRRKYGIQGTEAMIHGP